jgi:GxxExxY protein
MYSDTQITGIVIEHAIYVHKTLGPGLLESVYESCLFYSLQQTDLHLIKEHPIPVIFGGIKLDCGYRADLLIENKVIVEIKAVENLIDIHKAQLLTYLKLTNHRYGLLINFNVVLLKNGIKRIVNGY